MPSVTAVDVDSATVGRTPRNVSSSPWRVHRSTMSFLNAASLITWIIAACGPMYGDPQPQRGQGQPGGPQPPSTPNDPRTSGPPGGARDPDPWEDPERNPP